jgi:hypothetical protein
LLHFSKLKNLLLFLFALFKLKNLLLSLFALYQKQRICYSFFLDFIKKEESVPKYQTDI